MDAPEPQELSIAERAYAVPVERKRDAHSGNDDRKGGAVLGPSLWTLTSDIETTTGPEQRLRVGDYQLRHNGELREEGLFYDPVALSDRERRRLRDYARRHGLVLRTVDEYVEQIVYRVAYLRNALLIGFNLPFDLARLAYHHEAAKGRKMGGGFSFSYHEHWPHPRIKHLSRTAALIDYASPGGQRTSRSWRRRGRRRSARRGFFCDVHSLAAALTGSSHSLASLALLLGTPRQKMEAEHGQELDATYIRYLRNDVQVTWECFEVLAARYASFHLAQTPVPSVLSEASIGKACLREMGIKPWRTTQPDAPPELIGSTMSSYFGGRSEIHIRREICRVAYCDFRSMYPTVSVLMGLWRFVIAKGIDWHEATETTRDFVDGLRLQDLGSCETWRRLNVLVQVEADGDLFPVRAAYDERSGAYSIGLNYLTCKEPLWFTLADVCVSKLLTGKTPKILRALAFTPQEPQDALVPIDILGNSDYHIDPTRDDFYLRVTELRGAVKGRMSSLPAGPEHERLDAEQQALKIASNASCYGIFVELNVQEYSRKREVAYYAHDGKPHTAKLASIEEPGRYFHPLLASLTTGAARLMLAIVEHLAEREGIGWAFCDTDSMALACPEGMSEEEFLDRAARVRGWFEQLNPYSSGGELLKLEPVNKALDAEGLEPLYCLAISDKRYALFNIDADGRPVLRKASAHGLGYLQPPYPQKNAPAAIPSPRVSFRKLGVDRWQYDLWYRIVEAALDGHPQQVRLDDLPGFSEVAMSRYAATRPRLLHWFDAYNKGKPYCEQVRPFAFMNAYQPKRAPQRDPWTLTQDRYGAGAKGSREAGVWLPRAVSPFHPDPAIAVQHCFDRDTGEAVPPELLRTNRQAVERYHMHPERKFHGGDYTESGVLRRRHIRVLEVNGIQHIGKEANRWDERTQTGDDPDAQIKYGDSGGSIDELRERVAAACREFGVRRVAREADVAHSAVLRFMGGRGRPRRATAMKLQTALLKLVSQRDSSASTLAAVSDMCEREGVSLVAARLNIDPRNLRALLTGRRRLGSRLAARLVSATGSIIIRDENEE
jgi:hypothetical protein